MKIRQFGVQSVLHFRDFEMDFGTTPNGFHVIYGRNEAGKSTLLRLLVDMLFGGKIDEEMKDAYDSTSRLTGSLAQDEETVSILRKKKYTKLILSDDGQHELPEQDLLPFLGGLDKERYQLLFGFDHDRLRRGGEGLLSSDGHAGISLFEAGGGVQYLQNALQRLTDRSGELLDPKFRKGSTKRLNQVWTGYQDAAAQVRVVGLRGEAWHRLRDEIAELERKVQSDRQCRESVSKEKAMWERVRRIRPLLQDWQRSYLVVQELQVAGQLPESEQVLIEQWMGELRECNRNIEQVRSQLLAKQRQADSFIIDENLIAVAPLVERLYKNVNGYTEVLSSLPAQRAQKSEKQASLRELLQDLHPGLSSADVESLRIPFADEERILQLCSEMNEAERAWKDATERYIELEQEQAEATKQLKECGAIQDVRMVEAILQTLGLEGDLDGALSAKQMELATKQQLTRTYAERQSFWQGPMEELIHIELPLRETVDAVQRELDRLSQQLVDIDREIHEKTKERTEVEQMLTAFEQAGHVPVESDLLNARTHRNTGWGLIKHQWLDGHVDEEALHQFAEGRPLVDAFETALDEADELSDRLRREADRSATRAQSLSRRDYLVNQLQRLQGQRDETATSLDRLWDTWTKQWEPSGIHPGTPAVMKEWLSDVVRPWIQGVEDVLQWREQVEHLTQRRSLLFNQLQEALLHCGERMPDNVSLLTLRQRAEHVVKVSRDMQNQRSHMSQQIQTLEYKRSQQDAKRTAARARVNELSSQWAVIHMKFATLPEELSLVPRYVTRLKELFQGVREVQQIRTALQANELLQTNFENEVRQLMQQLHMDDVSPSYEHIVESCFRRLRESVQNQELLRSVQAEIQSIQMTLEQEQLRQIKLQQYIDECKTKYACQNEDALHHLVESSKSWRDAKRYCERLEQQILSVGDGLPFEQLRAEVDQHQVSDVDGHISDAERELQAFEREISATQEVLWERRRAFSALDGSSTAAADVAQQAASRLAEVDETWNEYIRVELARQLLQRSMEAFRQKNESVILQRANALFQRLTLGQYTGLSVEYDDLAPHLEVRHTSGQHRRMHQLSDGTRDQVHLALRMAFVEQHVASSIPVPLIMDDILVHFDDARAQATLDVLADLATKTQIIYFTHHESVIQAVQNSVFGHPVQVHVLEHGSLVAPVGAN